MPGRRLTATLLGAGLLLTGCSGEAADTPGATLPPATSTPSASATATAADEVPPEAKAATPEGAAAFVRHFYERIERAYAERDPEVLRPVVDADCEACNGLLAAVARLRDDNNTLASPYRITVKDVVVPGLEAGQTEVVALAIFDESELVRLDESGVEQARLPALSGVAQDVRLMRVGESWRVEEVVNK
jgi:predicted lipid-binding transport protein (Tim44 family)